MMTLQLHTERHRIQLEEGNIYKPNVRIYSNCSVESLDQRNTKCINYFITCLPEALVWRVTGALLPMPHGHPNSSHDLSYESGQMKGLLGIRRTYQAACNCKRSGNTNLP